MTRGRDRHSLRHMLDHSREAHSLIEGKTHDAVDTDRLLNLALVRLLEIVGEAANRISPRLRSQHPEVSWPDIVSLRNRLIHGYDEIDLDILWQILAQDLPPLIEQLDDLIETFPDD